MTNLCFSSLKFGILEVCERYFTCWRSQISLIVDVLLFAVLSGWSSTPKITLDHFPRDCRPDGVFLPLGRIQTAPIGPHIPAYLLRIKVSGILTLLSIRLCLTSAHFDYAELILLRNVWWLAQLVRECVSELPKLSFIIEFDVLPFD